MLILILLCFVASFICAMLRYFNQPNPPAGRDLGWLAFAFLVLGFLIEYASKYPHGV